MQSDQLVSGMSHIGSALLLAVAGYLLTYFLNLVMSLRRDRLALINKRIEEFYGPLYVAVQTNRSAIKGLMKRLGRKSLFHDPDHPPTQEELREWRLWLEHVFMPRNELLERLIMEKAYLIREPDIPQCLLDFVVHVSGYRAILAGPVTEAMEHRSVVDFPPDLEEYATRSYLELKRAQLRHLRERGCRET